jgi:hypothetical protein
VSALRPKRGVRIGLMRAFILVESEGVPHYAATVFRNSMAAG